MSNAEAGNGTPQSEKLQSEELKMKCEPLSDEGDVNSRLSGNTNTYQCSFKELIPVTEEKYKNDANVPVLSFQHFQEESLEFLGVAAPVGPAAIPVCVEQERQNPYLKTEILRIESTYSENNEQGSLSNLGEMVLLSSSDSSDSAHYTQLIAVKDKAEKQKECSESILDTESEDSSESIIASQPDFQRHGSKGWTQNDMDKALEALNTQKMTLTKASATFGIPSTTLWQRAHRAGIETPKREGCSRNWTEEDLNAALQALREGAISANKASKAFGIPSSTLYKAARRCGVPLAPPFHAAAVRWRRADLPKALLQVRRGAAVQSAAKEFGIPTGTLYGRCKREGIELSRSNPTPWSEGAMGEALEAVRVGQMSINQAAIHYNLPYSSLYGRFKRCKPTPQSPSQNSTQIESDAQGSSLDTSSPSHHETPPHPNTVHHFPVYEDTANYDRCAYENNVVQGYSEQIYFPVESTQEYVSR